MTETMTLADRVDTFMMQQFCHRWNEDGNLLEVYPALLLFVNTVWREAIEQSRQGCISVVQRLLDEDDYSGEDIMALGAVIKGIQEWGK